MGSDVDWSETISHRELPLFAHNKHEHSIICITMRAHVANIETKLLQINKLEILCALLQEDLDKMAIQDCSIMWCFDTQ
jgi:hypothetical protein